MILVMVYCSKGYGYCQAISLVTCMYLSLFPSPLEISLQQNPEGRQALAAEYERNLPGVILASKEEFFVKMEDLCGLGSSSIIKAVRNLLMLVPTDSRRMQAMEVFSPQAGGGASDDSQANSASPQAVLEQLFSTSGNSPTQLLYNLEVRYREGGEESEGGWREGRK